MTTERIETLRQFVADDPTDGLTRFMLGKELLAVALSATPAGGAMEQLGEAVEHLSEAVRLSPDHTAGYRELGNALAMAARPDEAQAVYEKGLAVAESTGDLQTGKEIRVFLARLRRRTC